MDLIFDQGTILIDSGAPAPTDADRVPGWFLWDRRVEAWRAPAFRLGASLRWFEARGTAVSYTSPRPAGFRPAVLEPRALPDLRDYQASALSAWKRAGHRGIISLPTGSGKTRIAIRAMAESLDATLVVVPTRALLRQWEGQLRKHFAGPLGVLGDGAHRVEPVTIATGESARRGARSLGAHFDLLIVDEAHHAAGLLDVLEMSTAPRRLGLSATFALEGAARATVEALLGPLVCHLPFGSLVGKHLAALEIHLIPVPLNRAERAAYDRDTALLRDLAESLQEGRGSISWRGVLAEASRTPEGRAAMEAWRRAQEGLALSEGKLALLEDLLARHRGERKLVFVRQNAAARAISERFLFPAITCETPRRERERILERFRHGTYRSIVSSRVLDEGIDVPEASVAVILGGGADTVAFAQRVGRVLRPAPGKRAIVYEIFAPATSDWKMALRRSRPGSL